MHKLKASARSAKADARIGREEELDRLEAKCEEMRKKLEEMRHSSDDAWDDIRAGGGTLLPSRHCFPLVELWRGGRPIRIITFYYKIS